MLTLVFRVQLSDADFWSRLATAAVATPTSRNFGDDRAGTAECSPAKPVGFDSLTRPASSRQSPVDRSGSKTKTAAGRDFRCDRHHYCNMVSAAEFHQSYEPWTGTEQATVLTTSSLI